MPSGLRPFYSWISLSLSKCATVSNESRPISQVVVLAHSHEEGLTRKQTASGQVLGLLEGQQRLLLVTRGWCRFERRCPGTAYDGGRQQVCRARGGAHARDTSEQANEMERVSERIQRHALTRDTGVSCLRNVEVESILLPGYDEETIDGNGVIWGHDDGCGWEYLSCRLMEMIIDAA